MLRLRVELGFASGRFMSRISSGWMGNLAHARILLYLSTSQEMVRKKGSSRSGKSQGIPLYVKESLFLREISKNWIFLPIQVL